MATAQPIAAQEFSHVVSAHRQQIFRFLLASTRDVDLAETLTQEAFLKAFRNWASFRGESTALTWLMRIAINVQKDHWRNRRLQFWRTTRTNSVDVDEAGGGRRDKHLPAVTGCRDTGGPMHVVTYVAFLSQQWRPCVQQIGRAHV